MGKAIDTCRDNLGYFNPPNVYRPAIIDIRVVGEYSAEDGATNTYRITQNDGKIFEFDVKNGSGGSAGRSVASVEQIQISTESLGKNIARINLSDGTYTDVEIRNGAQGQPGSPGERGPAGIDSVEASIGTNDPTQAPSVEKELSEGVLSLTFNNIKGEKGDQGEPAVAVENYVAVEATSSTTSATDVLPATGSSDTVYRVSNWDGTQYNTNAYTEYGWYDGAYKMLATRTPGIDDEPTAGSQKLVKSGGVAAQISQLGQQVIYDVSAHNSGATFASLSALLSDADLATLIPTGVRCGGMSIRFIQTSDNKYVQYRLMANAFSTNTVDWYCDSDNIKTLNERIAEIPIMTHYGGWFNSGGEISSVTTARFVVIPINNVSTYVIKTNTANSLALYYLDTFSGQPESGDILDLVSGTNRIVLDENREYTLSIPTGTNYIAITVVTVSGNDCSPQKLLINNIDYTKPIREIISTLFTSVNSLQTEIGALSNNLDSTNTMLGKESGVTPQYNVILNRYIKSDGTIVIYNNYNMTSPILMFANDKITIKTRFYNTGIAVIAKTNIDGTRYTQVVESNADSEAVEYTYTATEKCYIALSYIAAQMVYIKMDMLSALHDIASDSGENIDSIDFLPLLSDNPLERINFTAGMTAAFRSWGFIGDSLSSGAFEHNEGGVWGAYDNYDESWGQYMCRLTGADGYNFSVGGEYAKRWILGSNDGNNLRRWGDGAGGVMQGGAHDNLKDAYIIALGVNDRANLATYYSDGIGTFSTDVDTSDYTNNNEDSFIGCYAGIIQRIQSVQPKAKIFLVSMPVDAGEPYNTQIQNCASAFDNCFYIDLYTYAPDYGEGHGDRTAFVNRYFTGNHMNTLGYLFTCYEMMTYIDWIIRKNFDKFSDIQFIGTNHSWTPQNT